MKKLNLKFITLSLLFSTLFFGCNFNDKENTKETIIQQSEKAKVYINIVQKNSAKAAISNLPENIYYIITATKTSDGTVRSSNDESVKDNNPLDGENGIGSEYSIDLDRDDWHFVAVGYSDENYKTPILTSSYNPTEEDTHTIEGGKYYFSIQVEQIKDGDGTGEINLPIKVENSTISKVKISSSNPNLNKTISVNENGMVNFAGDNLLCGTFSTYFSFYTNYNNKDYLLLRTPAESINIRQNFATQWADSGLSTFIENGEFVISAEKVKQQTNTSLYVDANASEDNTTGTWKYPFKTLQDAVNRAAALNAEYAKAITPLEELPEFSIKINGSTGDTKSISVNNPAPENILKLKIESKSGKPTDTTVIPVSINFGSKLDVKNDHITFEKAVTTSSPINLETCDLQAFTAVDNAGTVKINGSNFNGDFTLGKGAPAQLSGNNNFNGKANSYSSIEAGKGSTFKEGLTTEANLELDTCTILKKLEIQIAEENEPKVSAALTGCTLGAENGTLDLTAKNSKLDFTSGNKLYLSNFTAAGSEIALGNSNSAFSVNKKITLDNCKFNSNYGKIDIRSSNSDAVFEIKNGSEVKFDTKNVQNTQLEIDSIKCSDSNIYFGSQAVLLPTTLNLHSKESSFTNCDSLYFYFTTINSASSSVYITDSTTTFFSNSTRVRDGTDSSEIKELVLSGGETTFTYYTIKSSDLKVLNGNLSKINGSMIGAEQSGGETSNNTPITGITIDGAKSKIASNATNNISAYKINISNGGDFSVIGSSNTEYGTTIYADTINLSEGGTLNLNKAVIDSTHQDWDKFIVQIESKDSKATLIDTTLYGTITIDNKENLSTNRFILSGTTNLPNPNNIIYLKNNGVLYTQNYVGIGGTIPVFHFNPKINQPAIINATGQYQDISYNFKFKTPGRILEPNSNRALIKESSTYWTDKDNYEALYYVSNLATSIDTLKPIDSTKEILFADSNKGEFYAITYILKVRNSDTILGTISYYDATRKATGTYLGVDNPTGKQGIKLSDYGVVSGGQYTLEIYYTVNDSDIYGYKFDSILVK